MIDYDAIFLQDAVAEINRQIRASGIASQEYKAVVTQYGERIIKLLMLQV